MIEPGRAGWTTATQAFNLTVVQEPAVVALPVDVQDVIAIVDFARENGMQVTAQRTGHNAEPMANALAETILVKTDALQGVEIDVERKIARVASGVKWGGVVPQASDLGLAALHGSTPDVSVTGYSLGGGVGWYARKLGLSTNSVTAIELVTADGAFRRVDHDNEPDLFWALRGGGGNFGIVTAVEVQLFSIPDIYAGILFFPWERASEVLHAWLEWTATVPDEMTSVGRLLQFPPIEEIPEPMRGKKFAIVEGIYMGDEASGSDLLRPLRELGPAIDTFAVVPPVGLAELHMDPPDPVPYTGEGQMLAQLDAEAIDRFVAAAGPGSPSPLISAEIRHVGGGAMSRPQRHHGALNTFDADFLTFGVGMVIDEASYRASRGTLDELDEALAPYDSGRQYLNFTERPTDPARFYTPYAYRRLRQVKAAYDPTNLIRANHPIPPA
ncbi:MAG TPA: FAD-binding oxidoreductase [Gaiellaceae bacterium]|nr:FAD-binding oxidoreductase [Gaiellaceae bacterium]